MSDLLAADEDNEPENDENRRGVVSDPSAIGVDC